MPKTLLFALPLTLLASACTYDNGHARRIDHYPATQPDPSGDNGCSPDSTPVQSNIDVDRQLVVGAGQGAGVFVEYAHDGHCSCAPAATPATCAWDIVVTPETGSSISNAVALDLESDDLLRRYPDDTNSYQLVATTGADLDGFTFESNPGAAVRVDALLDGQCARRFFYWFGDGALHSGSPTNPLDLIPSAEVTLSVQWGDPRSLFARLSFALLFGAAQLVERARGGERQGFGLQAEQRFTLAGTLARELHEASLAAHGSAARVEAPINRVGLQLQALVLSERMVDKTSSITRFFQ